MATFDDTIAETIGAAVATPVAQTADTDDSFTASYLIDVIHAQLVTASETLGLAPAVTPLYGMVIAEVLGLAPSILPNQIAGLTVTDTVEFLDELFPGLPVALSETLGVSISLVAQQVIEIIEELEIEELLAPAAVYHLSYADTLGLAEAYTDFFGVAVSETLGVAESMAGNQLALETISETVGVAPTLTPNLILRVTAEDEIGIEDTELLNAIYTGTVSDGLEITAAYLSPGGGFVTWAMNTRTGAVTEYDNYQFNSFAAMGTRYLGANESGLYELNGDDDDGDNIIARLKSGFAQWAGAKFTLFKGIYLGVRGEGDFVLRLTTGEGDTYNYSVATRNMRSTKVHLGKGLRARYFAFELISEGQDFDLESIEFVPLVAQRRV